MAEVAQAGSSDSPAAPTDDIAAKVSAVYALLPVLHQQAAVGAAAASAARAEVAELAAQEEADAARHAAAAERAAAEKSARAASSAQLAERSHLHATAIVESIAGMDEELEAAARSHAATVSELATNHAQVEDEVARAAASTGVQLTRGGSTPTGDEPPGSDAYISGAPR